MTYRGLVALLALCVCPIGLSHGEEVKLDYNDVTLNAELVQAPGKSLGDGAILLTHGLLAHGRMEIIDALQKLLAARGFASLAPTLSLGLDDRHGMFDCALRQRHTHDTAVAEIGVWTAWLKTHGARRIVLAGHSNGGTETARFAATRLDPAVVALTLLAPGTWNSTEVAAQYEQTHGMPFAPELAYAEALVASGRGDAILEDVAFLQCDHAWVSAASFISYYGNDPMLDTPRLLARIVPPVLVIAAGRDQIVRDLPMRIGPLADGRNVTLVTIDGADHFFRNLYAEDAADAIVRFLRPILQEAP
jgi:pimeloyl-ACP methyl ester carboxylesterase